MLVVHEKILPFEMILRGHFQGTLQYWEVPLVEMLPPPVSLDSALALVGPPDASSPRSDSSIGQVLIDAPVGGVSHEDPQPSDTEGEESSIGLLWCRTPRPLSVSFPSWIRHRWSLPRLDPQDNAF